MNKLIKIDSLDQDYLLIKHISEGGKLEFDACSDDGREILYEINITPNGDSNIKLSDIVKSLHENYLDYEEGSGEFIIENNKLFLSWNKNYDATNDYDVPENFIRGFCGILSLPDSYELDFLKECHYELEGDISTSLTFDKFDISLKPENSNLDDYDFSEDELKKYLNGYVFVMNQNFEIEMANLILKIVSSITSENVWFNITGEGAYITNFSINIYNKKFEITY